MLIMGQWIRPKGPLWTLRNYDEGVMASVVKTNGGWRWFIIQDGVVIKQSNKLYKRSRSARRAAQKVLYSYE